MAGGGLDALQWVTISPELENILVSALPQAQGQRNRQVFELARALKATPYLADAPPEPLEPLVRRWHAVGVARGVIRTEPFEETWIDFLKGWPRVQFPKGNEPMVAIFEQVRRSPLPAVASRYQGDGMRLLVGLCRELQELAGEQPFFLACRTAGRLLGVDFATANRWLFLLAHDQIIEVVEKGDRIKRRASRYRYLAG